MAVDAPSVGHARAPRALPLAALGLVLGVLGVAGYVVVAVRFGAWLPRVRNDALPSWLLIAAGISLSALAVARAGRRLVPGLLLGLNVALAAAFAAMLYVLSVIPARAGPPVGVPAPDFALLDQAGRTVRLADFRGSPLLLVFYRGHW